MIRWRAVRASSMEFAVVTIAVIALALAGARPCAARSASLPDGFVDSLVTAGLDAPVGMAFLPDGRLLFVEQNSGRIRFLARGAVGSNDPLVTVPGVNSGGERGLLGIAVDPAWPTRPYVYVHFTHITGSTTAIYVSRFTVTGDLGFNGDGSLAIDPASRYDLLNDLPDDDPRHNGGTLRFGPDGRLYVSVGEDHNQCTAQDTASLHGVILRLDVSRLPAGPGSPPSRSLITPSGNPFVNGSPDARLVWAFGLRNPFRFHIDPGNGVLYIGDVGEAHWEEIDRADHGGIDFGWPRYEGPQGYDSSCPLTFPRVDPIFSFDRSGIDPAAIVSGGIYRRPAGATFPFPAEYEGDYFFADYFIGDLIRLTSAGGVTWTVAPAVAGQPSTRHWAEGLDFVSDYLVGPDGGLWYCREYVGGNPGTGEIHRIAPGTAVHDTVVRVVVSFERPYPLPAPGYANLVYTLSNRARVELVLYDLRGRVARHLIEPRILPLGRHSEVWDGSDDDARAVRPGMYFARLLVNGKTYEQRVPLIR